MKIRKYLNRKGQTVSEANTTPRHYRNRLRAHSRPATTRPLPASADDPGTRGPVA